MKPYKNSVLFFYLCCAVFILNAVFTADGQEIESIDSLSYYSGLALKPKKSTDRTNAYAFFKRHSEQRLKDKDSLGVIYDLRFIAIIQFDLGLLQESETTAVSALEVLDNLKITNATTAEHRLGLNNHLGRVYRRLNDYPSALNYYNTALNLQQDPKRLNAILNNIGFIYYKQADYQKALDMYTSVHQTNLKSNDTRKIARSLSNLGMTLSKMKRPQGLDSLTKALQLRESINYKKGIMDSYFKLAAYHQDRGDLSRANVYAIKADRLAKSLGNIQMEVEALALLMQLHPNKNVQRYAKLVDSLNTADLTNQNSYAAKKYALEKQERLAKDNELKLTGIALDNERQKRLKTSYLFLGILILLSAIFSVVYLRSKHKKETLQEVYNTESRISKKIHDEVANDVYHVMTKLQTNGNPNDDLLDDLDLIYAKTRDISKEHSAIHVKDDFNQLIMNLLLSYQNADVNVVTKNAAKIDWTPISTLKKTTIYRVLQELMTNMRKHSKATIVVISFEHHNGHIRIQYKDNGIGCNLFKSNGLQNTESRMESINGSITFETQINDGFTAILSI